MISALLLPLLLAGTPATVGGEPSGAPPIRLWINDDGRFLPGDHAKVQVRTQYDGYLIVFHVDPDGYLRVLFPLDPDKDNFVRGDKKYEVRGRGGHESFEADGKGRGTVYAAVTHEPLRFDGFVTSDHWDYRALAPSRLPENPEAELNELVRRMAQGNFDYDLLSYEAIESVVYASDNSYFPGNSAFFPGNFAISAGFFFGQPFRRFDPFFFGFDPFFFDPFVNRAFFVDPFFPRPFFRQPVFGGRFVSRPFFFSPGGLGPVPFRDRFTDFGRAATTARLTSGWARRAATASRGPRAELRRETSVRPTMTDALRPAIEARRANWPVDVSPWRRDSDLPSSPPDRGSDRGSWSSPSGRGGDDGWGFARPFHSFQGGGFGASSRR